MHEPVVSRALIDLLDSDSVFFDIGAHLGYYTVLASQYCTDVRSFEIDPQMVGLIDSHFECTDVSETNVEIICSAVTDQYGNYASYTPHQAEDPSTNSINYTESDGGGRISVPTVSIDAYCATTGISPDVLKVDVEGFEVDVLAGMEDIARTVDALLLEVHPSLLSRYRHDLSTLFSLLDEYGFTSSRFVNHRDETIPESALEPVEDTQDITDNCMLLCTK
jgi:FkbM family methyltransferase